MADHALGAKGRAHYIKHYKMVRELTPPDRLLEYKLSNGWEPLCKHLGKPVPDEPFPYLNESEWFDEMIAILLKVRLLRLVKTWGAYVVAAFAAMTAVMLAVR